METCKYEQVVPEQEVPSGQPLPNLVSTGIKEKNEEMENQRN